MRISDWSSDVCSSDLHAISRFRAFQKTRDVEGGIGGDDRANALDRLRVDVAVGHDRCRSLRLRSARLAGHAVGGSPVKRLGKRLFMARAAAKPADRNSTSLQSSQ